MSQSGVEHLAVTKESRVERIVSISNLAAALKDSSSPTDPISSIKLSPNYQFCEILPLEKAQGELKNGGAALRTCYETLELITEMDLVKWMLQKTPSAQNRIANGGPYGFVMMSGG